MKKYRSFQPKASFKQRIILVVFGIFLFFVVLEAGLRLGGFVISSLQEHQNNLSIRKRGTYRIMCLGESTTHGQYSSFLENKLNQRNTGIRFSVVEKGLIGNDTSAILAHLESNLDRYNPDMVITMMGINDGKEYISYEAAATSKAMLFIKSFKTYKLTRLLWLHILTKAKEAGFYKSNTGKQYPEKIQTYLPGIKLKEAYTEPVPMKDLFRKAIELNSQDDIACLKLGKFYQEQGDSPKAEDAFKKAVELNPKNDNAYIDLGWFYEKQGDLSKVEDLFKKAIESNPKNYRAYIGLGWFYREQNKLSQAEDAFKKSIELNPQDNGAYFELGWIYREQNKLSQAEEVFKKAIELAHESDRIYVALSLLYQEMGKTELAEEYDRKANIFRLTYYNPFTVNNYHKLKEILDKRGIKLVCVQYPMRNAEPLKKIFDKDTGIIFVDNESVFKDALNKGNYKDYFRDMFGGDFGHCTDRGNKLLAKNIANVILKELFDK